MRSFPILAFIVASGLSAAAQNTPAVQFDVASVKRSPDPFTLPVVRVTTGTLEADGRWIAAQAALSGLIRNAYPAYDHAEHPSPD